MWVTVVWWLVSGTPMLVNMVFVVGVWDSYVGYCGVVVGVCYSYVGYCDEVVGVWESCGLLWFGVVVWCLGLVCGLLWCSGWCMDSYVGYCGVMVGVWDSYVGYCGVVVGVWDSYVG